MHKVRAAIAALCVGAGFLFLTINSVLLARGAIRWGLEAWEKVAYAAVAATVPWVIAIMPFLVTSTFKGQRFKRPSLWTLVALGMWLTFAAYNLIGASGAISFVRGDVIASRKHDLRAQQGQEDRRKALATQRDAIPAGRPAASVEALIAAEKNNRNYALSAGCTQVLNNAHRAVCSNIERLQAEAEASRTRAKLDKDIEDIDLLLNASGPVAEAADPQAKFIADYTGLKEATVAQFLPIMTPLVLEIGSMTLLAFAVLLYGWSHRMEIPEARDAKPEQQTPTEAPKTTPETSSLNRQVDLATWFFGHCMRRVPSGALSEREWYAHYRAVCERSKTTALPVESFRRIAAKNLQVKEVNGDHYYLGFLPIIPANAA